MSTTLVEITTKVSNLIDPAATTTEENNYVAQAIKDVYLLRPTYKQVTGASVAQTKSLSSRRIAKITHLHVDNEPYAPLDRTNPDFTTANHYYHVEQDTDDEGQVTITLSDYTGTTLDYAYIGTFPEGSTIPVPDHFVTAVIAHALAQFLMFRFLVAIYDDLDSYIISQHMATAVAASNIYYQEIDRIPNLLGEN